MRMMKNKKGLVWYLLIPMVVPLWLFLYGSVKFTFFTDWDGIMKNIMIIGGIIIVVMFTFKKK